MKRLILIIFIMVLTITMSSCGKYINSDKEGDKKSDELIQYLSDKNENGLKEMFCKITAASGIFDKQIEEAIYFLEGKVTSYDLPASSGGGRTIRDGKTIRLSVNPHITNIVTDTGETYEIYYSCYLINTKDEDKVGISKLTIISADGSECAVGEFVD